MRQTHNLSSNPSLSLVMQIIFLLCNLNLGEPKFTDSNLFWQHIGLHEPFTCVRNIKLTVMCTCVFVLCRYLPGCASSDDSGCGAGCPRGADISFLSEVSHNEQHGGHHQGQDEPHRWHHVHHCWYGWKKVMGTANCKYRSFNPVESEVVDEVNLAFICSISLRVLTFSTNVTTKVNQCNFVISTLWIFVVEIKL